MRIPARTVERRDTGPKTAGPSQRPWRSTSLGLMVRRQEKQLKKKHGMKKNGMKKNTGRMRKTGYLNCTQRTTGQNKDKDNSKKDMRIGPTTMIGNRKTGLDNGMRSTTLSTGSQLKKMTTHH